MTSAQDSSLGFIVKVGDFGLSRKADCQVLLEQTELGTLIYKAPELGQGAPFSKVSHPPTALSGSEVGHWSKVHV